MIRYLKEKDEFFEIIKSGDYLVDFHADWCGPCKMLNGILEQVENIDILKVDVDEFKDIANKFGVMSIPTMILFRNGTEVKKEIGFKNKSQIEEMIK